MKTFEITWVQKPELYGKFTDIPEFEEAPAYVQAKNVEEAVKKLKKLNFKTIDIEHIKSYYRSIKVLA